MKLSSLSVLSPQDQDTSSQQDCLQIPTSMDPVIGTTQGCLHDPSTALWQQHQQQTLQPALALLQGDLFQQQAALDAASAQVLLQALQQGNSSLDATSAELLLQALLQENSAPMDLSGLSASLQGSNLLPMQQQGIHATIKGLPVVLHVQDTTPGQGLQQLSALHVLQLQDTAAGQGLQQLPSNIGQCMEQVYCTPAEQQLYIGAGAAPDAAQQPLLINTDQVAMQQTPTQATMQPVQQQQLLAGSATNVGSSTDPVLHLQLQQLQEAVQQLSSQTAEVQRVLATQVSQPQASQGQTVMLSMEVRASVINCMGG
jgi:hypothetical protein